MPQIRKVELKTDSVPAHWSLVHAMRELIANAFDEAEASGTGVPVVRALYPGCWSVRDSGRGLDLERLSGCLASEKPTGSGLAAHRGTGLLDALATLARAGAAVLIRSRHGDFVVASPAGDVLRALVFETSDPSMSGTEILLDRIPDREAQAARDGFLGLRSLRIIEATEFGAVLAAEGTGGEVFVDGIRVFEDPELRLSFDLHGIPGAMKRAILRQGSNVARTFCLDRVRRVLRRSRSPEVALLCGDAAAGFTLAA